MAENPYLTLVHQHLPRILALIDQDPLSASYGLGDRYFWSWGLKDFANGTFQGFAHGLARLLVNEQLPEDMDKERIYRLILAQIDAALNIQRSNGSFEEAFPYEGSYCVTALVAFDVLSALQLLKPRIENNSFFNYLNQLQPTIAFLSEGDETHGVISNHLATAVAALAKWHKLKGGSKGSHAKLKTLVQRIAAHQSKDGWLREYQGPDPGYQTLCLYYLAAAHQDAPDLKLDKLVAPACDFLQYFIFPDGAMGGLVGSRNTRIYYPAGMAFWGSVGGIASAAAVEEVMRTSVAQQKTVTLAAIDESNLAPVFNSYCWGAELWQQELVDHGLLPCHDVPQRKLFAADTGDAAAPILVDRGDNHYTVIAAYKGGTVQHYQGSQEALMDPAVFASKASSGQIYCNQHCNGANPVELEGDMLQIQSTLAPVSQETMKPWQMLVLRGLAISVLRHTGIREWFKRYLAKRLVAPKPNKRYQVLRRIELGYDLQFEDELPKGHWQRLIGSRISSGNHMASQGYWQRQDTE